MLHFVLLRIFLVITATLVMVAVSTSNSWMFLGLDFCSTYSTFEGSGFVGEDVLEDKNGNPLPPQASAWKWLQEDQKPSSLSIFYCATHETKAVRRKKEGRLKHDLYECCEQCRCLRML